MQPRWGKAGMQGRVQTYGG